MGFDSFLGNAKAVETVRGMLSSGRVPGALLFSGPEGVGKKTLAVMLAKAINCERRAAGGDDFCGECARCRKADEMLAASAQDAARRRDIKDAGRRVEDLVYFDLQLIEPLTRYILIEQIRQLRAVAYSHPFELRERVFILDPAHAIHWQATDLLLKVLEEPPETSTLILVCANPHELRATIRSRCVYVRFARVEDSVIERILREESKVPPAARPLALRVAAGSVAAAKSFNLAEYERQRRPWLDFLGQIATDNPSGPNARDWEKLFEATKALTENRQVLETALRIGAELSRDLLHALAEGESAALVNVDLAPRLAEWAKPLGLEGIRKLSDALEQAYRLQTRNVNQQLGLEAAAAEIVGKKTG